MWPCCFRRPGERRGWDWWTRYPHITVLRDDWQFEKTTRMAGEDPSIFVITLKTLAVKAFGDMGQTARFRLIRDRFIAGNNSCELRRHLDSVPPDTPIRC